MPDRVPDKRREGPQLGPKDRAPETKSDLEDMLSRLAAGLEILLHWHPRRQAA